jgi:hypothetical protein
MEKVMLRLAIVILAVCSLSCCQQADQKQESTPTRFTKESVKTLLERTEANATLGWQAREALRAQMKVLNLTLLVTLFGFAFAKDSAGRKNGGGTNKEGSTAGRNGRSTQKGVLLFLACLLCGLMYGLDTYLLDISNRQLKYRSELNEYLVQIDSLSTSELQIAVTKAFSGLEKPEPFAKITLLLCPPRPDDWFWYFGIPLTLIAVYFGFSSWRHSIRK